MANRSYFMRRCVLHDKMHRCHHKLTIYGCDYYYCCRGFNHNYRGASSREDRGCTVPNGAAIVAAVKRD